MESKNLETTQDKIIFIAIIAIIINSLLAVMCLLCGFIIFNIGIMEYSLAFVCMDFIIVLVLPLILLIHSRLAKNK